jgi:uncharacterized protein YoxC
MTALTSADVLTYLWIAVAALLLIVLYHVLFLVVDMRKITRRVDEISEQIESMIMAPISVADQILTWIMELIEKERGKDKHEKKITHPKKD